jgi:hypothetical protein
MNRLHSAPPAITLNKFALRKTSWSETTRLCTAAHLIRVSGLYK